MVVPTLRVNLLSSVKLFWKYLHKHTQVYGNSKSNQIDNLIKQHIFKLLSPSTFSTRHSRSLIIISTYITVCLFQLDIEKKSSVPHFTQELCPEVFEHKLNLGEVNPIPHIPRGLTIKESSS